MKTLGHQLDFDVNSNADRDRIIDMMTENGAWCVGTPDDLIATIKRLDAESGGFGGFMIQATEWGTREQVLHSYELVARYVMPHFQGSIASLDRSQVWSEGKKAELLEARAVALERARTDYVATRN